MLKPMAIQSRSLTLSGECYITDPCYYIKGGAGKPDEEWAELGNIWFQGDYEEHGLYRANVSVVRGVSILVSRTAYGDGDYKVKGAGSFCVDSGSFAIAEVRKLVEAGFELDDEGDACSTRITLPDHTVVHLDGEGRMFAGSQILVNTVDQEDEEDEDYEDDDE